MAIGDSIGFLVEGNPSSQCARVIRIMAKLAAGKGDETALAAIGKTYYPFGQYSDDTQLGRELILAFMDAQKAEDSKTLAEPAARLATLYASRMASLYQQHKVVGCGMGTAQALTKLIKGAPYTEVPCILFLR